MIELLKKECEMKIGLKLKNLGDCKFLSHSVFDILNTDLNYNTIRRLWGLAPYVKPRITTLDILSQFVGFNNFSHFTNTYLYNKELKTQDKIYILIYKDDQNELFSFIKKNKRTSTDFPNLIIRLSRELVYAKDFDLLNQLFLLKELQYDSFSYTEALYIGNSVGLLIRKNPFQHTNLQNNTNFIRLVYLTFVDYSSLTGYYGDWSTLIIKQTQPVDVVYFCKAITQWKNFLVNKPIKDTFDNSSQLQSLHPILLGRILSVRILANNYEAIDLLLDPYFQGVSKKNSTQLELAYELMIIAITTSNITLMGYLRTQINPTIKPKFYYHKYHINVYYLMCMFYYKLTNDKLEKKKFNQLFVLNELRSSYEEFCTLFVLIFNYSETNSLKLKSIYKERYLSLASQLNYPYFSNDLLKEYFINKKYKPKVD